MKITLEKLKGWKACYWSDYGRRLNAKCEYVEDMLPATPLEVLEWDIPIADKLWVVLREELIPVRDLHLLACDFADSVLHIFEEQCPDDKAPRKAIATKRLWIDGLATDEELSAARALADVSASFSDSAIAAAAAAARASVSDSAFAAAAASASAAALYSALYLEQKTQLLLQLDMVWKVLERLA